MGTKEILEMQIQRMDSLILKYRQEKEKLIIKREALDEQRLMIVKSIVDNEEITATLKENIIKLNEAIEAHRREMNAKEKEC